MDDASGESLSTRRRSDVRSSEEKDAGEDVDVVGENDEDEDADEDEDGVHEASESRLWRLSSDDEGLL